MPMRLDGSCQCGGVRFHVLSHTPVPYQLCTCSICRKVGGHMGAINLSADHASLQIQQGQHLLKKYHAVADRDTADQRIVSSERVFCGTCSAMLWLWDEQWPELVHPFASAIDTPLPVVEGEEVSTKGRGDGGAMVCVMADSKPDWARWPDGPKRVWPLYAEESIEEWHKKHGKYVE
ncbi:MAG: hypothetical protein M1826_001095 [Phylliscum demangeonii]|nr:MAG: hypothetical protein M1826_001095 [Phylliscum demangeonii]